MAALTLLRKSTGSAAVLRTSVRHAWFGQDVHVRATQVAQQTAHTHVRPEQAARYWRPSSFPTFTTASTRRGSTASSAPMKRASDAFGLHSPQVWY
jgi:hypothetical protein